MQTSIPNTREAWREGRGPLRRKPETVARIEQLAEGALLVKPDRATDLFRMIEAADALCSAAMWTVVHMTYANRVDLSGAPLPADAFKDTPEGHTGGSLNMVPAYVGYLLANALSGVTRSWLMGQGHCVAAIEAVNSLTGDVSPAQKGHYGGSEAGLSRLVKDFYSHAITAQGTPAVPLGSHAGPNTAGAILEGGYLGFAGLQYIHMPLPGERLVAFLSDGAFEEQRGSDWSPRWWRAEDSGFAVPVMILNGRRIEERTEIARSGGASWFAKDLRHNGFEPIRVDGGDPASIAWGILKAEGMLTRFSADPDHRYPARLPYVIAETVKGYGFYGAGTNAAHNLPLQSNPRFDSAARAAFNRSAGKLFIPAPEIKNAVATLATHEEQNRVLESQHALAHRNPDAPVLPDPEWARPEAKPACAMHALDRWFVALIEANPELRVRLGNPDELRSNHMGATLGKLQHRVNSPELGNSEAVDGKVITALNEEAIAAAALGNKGGLNLIVSYEAFAMKMLGGLRQDIIFARRQRELGHAPRWISVPLIVTSHTWENAKNEQSHQDPTIGEALLGEMSDTARVLFPFDANSALAGLKSVYSQRGGIACLIVSKRDLPHRVSGAHAEQMIADGGGHITGDLASAKVQFVAIGAYQLSEALKACRRLEDHGVAACVTAITEPARFRTPRDPLEASYTASDAALESLFPKGLARVILTHTRPEPMLGLLRRIDAGPHSTIALGYISRGGTLDVPGMLFANRCTWAHATDAAARVCGLSREEFLSPDEVAALDGQGVPEVLTHPDTKMEASR
ncbi:xylulose 5-phosphate 3-epimerase [Sulfitobacter sp.]|uniref:xylulose 5-phosphate 3-epimerase n=1 Tax=Sulfitobacter sp. TaxID=1903071 RepID=UPI00300262E6